MRRPSRIADADKKIRKVIPPGYQVRRALGRDEDEGVCRVELKFTLEEWEEIELKAAKKGMYPREWVMSLVRKRIGSS